MTRSHAFLLGCLLGVLVVIAAHVVDLNHRHLAEVALLRDLRNDLRASASAALASTAVPPSSSPSSTSSPKESA